MVSLFLLMAVRLTPARHGAHLTSKQHLLDQTARPRLKLSCTFTAARASFATTPIPPRPAHALRPTFFGGRLDDACVQGAAERRQAH